MEQEGRDPHPISPERGESKEVKKQKWEQEMHAAILAVQEASMALKNNKNRETILQHNEAWATLKTILFNAPMEYPGMILELVFEAEDMAQESNATTIEKLHVQPTLSEGKRRVYHFPVVSPHRIDWSKSGFGAEAIAHKGSYVREYRAQHPDLESIRYKYGWPDRVTRQNGLLQILPDVNEFSEFNFNVFPRNLSSVTLTEELPSYLTDEQKDAVKAWHERELGST